MIRRYRKRPEPFEAVQYTGDNINIILAWIEKATGEPVSGRPTELGIEIVGSKHTRLIRLGYYIMLGARGRLLPCDPDTFERVYEALE